MHSKAHTVRLDMAPHDISVLDCYPYDFRVNSLGNLFVIRSKLIRFKTAIWQTSRPDFSVRCLIITVREFRYKFLNNEYIMNYFYLVLAWLVWSRQSYIFCRYTSHSRWGLDTVYTLPVPVTWIGVSRVACFCWYLCVNTTRRENDRLKLKLHQKHAL